MAAKSVIDPQLIISHHFPQSTYTYTERDAALYALGIGACSKDAVDDKELKYVYHQDGQQSIEVFPTFAALFTGEIQSKIAEIQSLEFDPRLVLHGQQYIEIYKPLPSNGCLLNKASVAGLHDKGKATVLEVEILSYEKESGALLCMNRMAVYLRGTGGGFSKSSQPYSYTKYSSSQTLNYKIPESQPFSVFEECTQHHRIMIKHDSQYTDCILSLHKTTLSLFRIILDFTQVELNVDNFCEVIVNSDDLALLYRLSGDYNPLHSDPKVAEIAGFSRPILHGLCTLGFAVRAITKTICRGEQSMIKNISGRFLLHVYPGETLITEMWLEGLRVLYQVKVRERKRAVLSGFVTLNRLSSSV